MAFIRASALPGNYYTERHKPLRKHTQRLACLTLDGGFKINDSKGEYAIYYDAVYSHNLSVKLTDIYDQASLPGGVNNEQHK